MGGVRAGMDLYRSMRVGVWEAVIWCMGVVVKADRMRIVIILCRVYSLLTILMCVLLFILQHISITNIILTNFDSDL